MNIHINNQVHNVREHASLLEIVLLINGAKLKGIAVAVNNKVIPGAQHAQFILQPNDRVLIIKATQGG